MKEFDITYSNIRLRVVCDEYIEFLIKEHFRSHVNFEESINIPDYTLVISDNISKVHGTYYRMIDKWFDNATLDCYIDNCNKVCYATNFWASTENYRNLLIQYFVANVFNRFLEINGYLGVHSSCVEKNRNGVLFVAGRNSGKTNCMLNLMNVGFNSVTNDKIALKKINEDVIGYGIAQSVSIRLSPEFCKQSQNQKYVELALQRGIEIKNKNMIEGNNIVLNDNELAALNNVYQVFDTPIICIIRPFYDPYVSEPVFDLLTKEQALELIRSQYMALVHDTTDFLREIKGDSLFDIDVNLTLNSLVDIPCYYCRQNENTTEQFCDKVKKLVLK